MRMPTLAEIESANSQRRADFAAETGLTEQSTLEEITQALPLLFQSSLTCQTDTMQKLLKQFPETARLRMAALSLPHATVAVFAEFFCWGYQTGYANGQSDAFDITDGLKRN